MIASHIDIITLAARPLRRVDLDMYPYSPTPHTNPWYSDPYGPASFAYLDNPYLASSSVYSTSSVDPLWSYVGDKVLGWSMPFTPSLDSVASEPQTASPTLEAAPNQLQDVARRSPDSTEPKPSRKSKADRASRGDRKATSPQAPTRQVNNFQYYQLHVRRGLTEFYDISCSNVAMQIVGPMWFALPPSERALWRKRKDLAYAKRAKGESSSRTSRRGNSGPSLPLADDVVLWELVSPDQVIAALSQLEVRAADHTLPDVNIDQKVKPRDKLPTKTSQYYAALRHRVLERASVHSSGSTSPSSSTSSLYPATPVSGSAEGDWAATNWYPPPMNTPLATWEDFQSFFTTTDRRVDGSFAFMDAVHQSFR